MERVIFDLQDVDLECDSIHKRALVLKERRDQLEKELWGSGA